MTGRTDEQVREAVKAVREAPDEERAMELLRIVLHIDYPIVAPERKVYPDPHDPRNHPHCPKCGCRYVGVYAHGPACSCS